MPKRQMTVLDLIARLQECPANAFVYVKQEPGGDGQMEILRMEVHGTLVVIVADNNGL